MSFDNEINLFHLSHNSNRSRIYGKQKKKKKKKKQVKDAENSVYEPYITGHPCLSSISNDFILDADLSGISETRNPESNFPLLAKVVQHFSLFGEGKNNQEKM
jgi:hypothetical protein